jgi:hypothetical protein
MRTEAPIKQKDYRKKYGIGEALMCSIKRQMGLPKGTRFVVESQVNKWRNEHPNHRQSDVYNPKNAGSEANHSTAA